MIIILDLVLRNLSHLSYNKLFVCFAIPQANNGIVRTVGEKTSQKYSHVDLVHMVGGVDAKRGAVTAGGVLYDILI